MANFHLQIISPEKVVFEGKIQSLTAPGSDGYLGVLANHAPMLTTLQSGALTVKGAKEGGTLQFALEKGGFLEIHDNQVTVLAEEVGQGKTPAAERLH